jgi:ATP-dependent Zn protease
MKLLLEFWPYGLKQAGVNWIDLISILDGKDMLIRQVSNEGLIPFRSGSANESPGWYVNLFASRS